MDWSSSWLKQGRSCRNRVIWLRYAHSSISAAPHCFCWVQCQGSLYVSSVTMFTVVYSPAVIILEDWISEGVFLFWMHMSLNFVWNIWRAGCPLCAIWGCGWPFARSVSVVYRPPDHNTKLNNPLELAYLLIWNYAWAFLCCEIGLYCKFGYQIM